MGTTEYVLLVLVIVVPLVIAGAVTLWSLKQVQYRPKRRRPRRADAEREALELPVAGGSSSEPSAS